MKYCSSKNSLRVVGIFLLIIISAILIGALQICFIEPVRMQPLILLIWIPVILLWAFVWVWLFRMTLLGWRKFQITEEGLVIQDLLRKPLLHKWQKISEIGICKVHYSTKGMPYYYDTVLRCVIGEEKKGPASGFGSWQGELYEAMHMKTVISIDYDTKVLEELQRKKAITDYRLLFKNPYDKRELER